MKINIDTHTFDKVSGEHKSSELRHVHKIRKKSMMPSGCGKVFIRLDTSARLQ